MADVLSVHLPFFVASWVFHKWRRTVVLCRGGLESFAVEDCSPLP